MADVQNAAVAYASVRYLEHDRVAFHLAARMDRLLFNRSSKAFVKNADPVRRTL